MFFPKNNVAVLDLTHAGLFIARKLVQYGVNVTAVDVYDTVDDGTLSELQRDYGIKVSKKAVPIDRFDFVVSPVHLDPAYEMLRSAREQGKDIISHHRAVGMILSHGRVLDGVKVIEVTGSKAKTSTASLLADMISRVMVVVLHTSRGVEVWKDGEADMIHSGLSIAPGSILPAIDILKSAEMQIDCCIFEVSIGGTGYADIGVITTLEPDYSIARSSSMASDAKLSMVRHGKEGSDLFLNARDKKAAEMAQELGRDFFTFSDSKELASGLQANLSGKKIVFTSDTINFAVDLNPFYNASSYTTAFAAAGAVALHMGVDTNIIVDVVSGFTGLAGRMQERGLDGRILIDNSNSGMDIRSAEKSLDYGLKRLGNRGTGKVMFVLGEEAAQVCEGLPPEDVAELVNRKIGEIDILILVGERMRSVTHERVLYASHLEEGLENALRLSSRGDLILSCVKCFR
ncbi:coenzyme F430 synthase [Methanolobus halotolerans]|uniref:Coenzyme F430 synthase n=1 Tax=Methanolobus halotolerans TaxID=2052935 RepID=A0A4E0QTQ7_9EURY|nr:coenzyme F430 synthase [Methanolobus halotolerans]TGC11385.1 coenzyme F430 synthase [Methanolobus halotolerans]